MSFISFDPQPQLTRQQIAAQVLEVALARGLDKLAAVIALMTIAVESGANGEYWCPANPAEPDSYNDAWPHDSESNDGRSVGYFQQQTPWWGTIENEMTLAQAADTFLSRLTDSYSTAASDANLAGQFAQQVQGSAYPDRYAQKWDEAWALINALPASPAPLPDPEEPAVSDKPSYNEFPISNDNSQDRAGTTIDLFLIHTQEPADPNIIDDAAAEDLANYLKSTEGGSNPVSYHDTISQASDGGVTVVNCVDPALACWAVGNANNRSINLCFAGSSVNWSRDQWLKQSNAIDVAAYIAVQRCQKFGISLGVVPPPYTTGTPGISDHKYVTDVLGWGTHTDVGPNFPWDFFAAAVAKYAALDTEPTAPPVDPPVSPPAAPTPVGPADDQITLRWHMLGDQSLVEAVAEMRDHLLGTNDRGKTGAV